MESKIMTNPSPDLLPCQHCGKDAVLKSAYGGKQWKVECDVSYHIAHWCDSQAEAIQRWNTRPPVDAARIKELEAAITNLVRADGKLLAELSNQATVNADLAETLRDAEEYFDQRADAEYLPDQAAPVGNEEMSLLVDIRAAIAKATP